MRSLAFDEPVWVLAHHSGHYATYALNRNGEKVRGLACFQLRDAASEFYSKYGGEAPYVLSRVPMNEVVEKASAQECEVFFVEEYAFTRPMIVLCGVTIICEG